MAMFETKRPTIDMGAASYSSPGVRDVGKEAFANLLVKAGGAAWEANVQSKIGTTQAGVEEEIKAFTQQATRKNQSVIEAQGELVDAQLDAVFGDETGMPPSAEEVKRLDEAKTQLAKVKRARANGIISESEMRAKIDTITRQGISLMPGRTQEFIAAKRESLGLYEGDIMLERERQSVLEAAASGQAKTEAAQLDYVYKQAVEITGYPTVDADGRVIPKQEYLRMTATLNQDIGFDKAVRKGTALDQVAAMENPETFDKIANSRLATINAQAQAIMTVEADPVSGEPLSIEQKLLELDRAKQLQLLELSRDYQGAVETPQYKALVSAVTDRFDLLKANIDGSTASNYSNNLVSSSNNKMTLAIMNDPVLSKFAIIKQAAGDGAIARLALPDIKNLMDATNRMMEGVSFGTPGSAASKQRQAVAVLAARSVTNELVGGNWATADKQDGINMLNGYFSNVDISEPATLNKVADYLASEDTFEVVKDLDPNAIANMRSTMADYLTDSMLSAFSGLYDTRKVNMSVSGSGIAFYNKDGQSTPKEMARLQATAALFNKMAKGMAHLQGSKNYEGTFEALGDVINNIGESNTLSAVEAEKKNAADWKEFKGWLIYGRGTREEYRQMIQRQQEESVPSNTLETGAVQDGFRFMGGDPADPARWTAVA